MTDWGHVAEMAVTAAVGSVPVIVYIWTNKRSAKADAQKRHEEQQKLVDSLVTERKYFPSHAHREGPGQALNADGIRYPPED